MPQSERSDVTAVPAMGVIAEALVALVLADAMLEKFGGDSLGEMRRNLGSYLAAAGQRWTAIQGSTGAGGERLSGPRPIVLVGLPGCGKTTAAELVAAPLGAPWQDLDAAIASGAGQSVARIFADHGEAHFRALERAAMDVALATPQRDRGRGGVGCRTGQSRGSGGEGSHYIYVASARGRRLATDRHY